MSAAWVGPATVVAAVGTGVTGGVFFAFSNFVMPGLRSAPEESGLRVMQAINQAAPNPAFMVVLFGSSAVATVLAVRALGDMGRDGAPLVVAGAAASLVTVVATVVFHVPRNDALAALDPSTAGSVAAWRDYALVWTRGNHVRTLASTAGAALLGLALRSGWGAA